MQRRIIEILILTIGVIALVVYMPDAISSIQKRNKTMTDFGNTMVKHFDLTIKMDGLPLKNGVLQHVDDKEIVVKFQRQQPVSAPTQP